MLLKVRGIPSHMFNESIVGRVTRNPLSAAHEILISENYLPTTGIDSFQAILTNLSDFGDIFCAPLLQGVTTFDHLAENDIVSVSPNGLLQTLYRTNSNQNFILATERCNSNCLMCSQPPKDRDDILSLYSIHKKMIPLIPKDCPEIGITGGEPTLMGKFFFEMLGLIKEHLPNTEIHCLTNGRSFAWKNIADRLAELGLNNLMLGIPIYSDYYQIHDYVVQAKNAFDQTIEGLYNLAANNQRIEIRVVLQKQSTGRLVKLAKYIYKNLPFVEHVTFMGLEYQGYTPFNIEKLWIDPVHYMDELGEACEYLADRKMNVSIYNSQLCIVPMHLWKFCRRSISDWKNVYLDECSNCAVNEQCGGLFESSLKKHSDFIKAIK